MKISVSRSLFRKVENQKLDTIKQNVKRKPKRKVGTSKLPSTMFCRNAHKAYSSARNRLGIWTPKILTEKDKQQYLKIKDFLESEGYDTTSKFLEDFFYGVMSISTPKVRKYKRIFLWGDKTIKMYRDYKIKSEKQEEMTTVFHSILELYAMLTNHKIDLKDEEGIKGVLLAGREDMFHEDYVDTHPFVTGKKRKGEDKQLWKSSFARVVYRHPQVERFKEAL